MKMLTLKVKPKMIFGIILALTGIVVISLTFVSNHLQETESVSAVVKASTEKERTDFLSSFGWKTEKEYETKELIIPEKWNDVYMDYNEVQKNQGFDLADYKGKSVTLYTYTVTNYKNIKQGVVADLLVCDGVLIGGDLCYTSAENGFLTGFNGE